MSSAEETLRDIVLHPISVVLAAIGIGGGLLHLPIVSAIWGATWANSGALFAAAGAASQFPSLVPGVSAETLQLLAFLFGGLFVLTRVDRWYDSFRRRLGEDTDGDDMS